MIHILYGFLYVGTVAVLTFFGARAAAGKQLNTQMRKCNCICREVDGIYPWVLQDLAVTLKKPEYVKRYNWMIGPIVCLNPDEEHVEDRIKEIQRIIYEGECIRIAAQQSTTCLIK